MLNPIHGAFASGNKKMNMEPLISIVMPLYNKKREVTRSINSVLNQSVKHYEFLIINDGSTDGSENEVLKYKDPRIRLVSQVNSGVSSARNRGIKESACKIIAFIDADDEWDSEFLYHILRLADIYPEAGMYATNYYKIDETGRKSPAIIRGLPVDFEGILPDYFSIASSSDPPIFSSAVAVRKELICDVGCFPLKIKAGEDLLTWARLAATRSVAYSTKLLVDYYVPIHGSRKGRLDIINDDVGEGLKIIYRNRDQLSINKESFKKYLSRWYEMRALTLLRSSHRYHAILAAVKSLFYYRRMRGALLFLFCLIPLPNTVKIYETIRESSGSLLKNKLL